MTPDEFWDACQRHDWTYNYSDDYGVWRRGESARRKLEEAKRGNDLFEAIFKAWHGYVFAGPAYGNERPPKPVREDFIPAVSTFPGDQPANIPGQTSLLD